MCDQLGVPVFFQTPTECGAGTTYTVPQGTRAVRIAAVGGAGGAGTLNARTNTIGASAPGGFGGEVANVVPVTPGTVLRVQVGAPGGDTNAVTGGGGRGGDTVQFSGGDVGNHSGSGGGASGVAADSDCALWLSVGGGGGGGGSGYSQ